MQRQFRPRRRQFHRVAACILASAVSLTAFHAACAQTVPTPSWETVLPSLQAKCLDCHGGKKTKGGVDLKRLETNPSVVAEYDLWSKVQDVLKSGEMPPDDAKALPEPERKALTQWVESALDLAAKTNAGDPGPVTLRRLTNAEFDYSIRDLTGVSFHFGKDFIPDGGGGEGFSNIGDALFLSPQQLDKVFTAARKLSEHATIMPGSGIRFAPERVGVRGPAQFKSDAESAMVVWYQKVSEPILPKDGENLRVAEYITACWKYRNRELTGATSLAALAQEAGLNAAFLENWWNFLNGKDLKSRYLDLTLLPWEGLPPPATDAPKVLPVATQKAIADIETQLNSWFLPAKWPVLRAQQDADELKSYPLETDVKGAPDANGGLHVHLVAGDLGDGNKGDIILVDTFELQRNGKKEGYLDWLTKQLAEDRHKVAALTDKTEQIAQKSVLESHIAEAERFLTLLGKHPQGLEVDPNTLVLQAPCVVTLPVPQDAQRFKAKGKLDVRNAEIEFASAQWMATTGTPPDPAKVIPGVISVFKRGTERHKKTGAEFGKLHNIFSMNLEHRLNEVATNRYRGGKPGQGIYYYSDEQLKMYLSEKDAVRLKQLHEDWRFVYNRTIPKNLEPEWDKAVLQHLEFFTSKAWRRPLSEEEKLQLKNTYASGIAQELDRESAAREVLVHTLVAPEFLYKLEQTGETGVRPVSGLELASRLSYFLWSTLPDDELRHLAESGALKKPEVLKAQTLRMLKDAKAEAMAAQFATQWFEFQNFDGTTKVDTAKFPEFTPELRRDLYREALTFLTHIVRENRPVREILTAEYTFLNERLAAYYGVPDIHGETMQKANVGAYARGGLLGMGALLTKTSYPHRTSPVLRGNWLLRTVLGTPTPPPPNDVPKLDESVAAASSLRERLERHRADKACAVCHDRIDPLGFALEGFDAIGRIRSKDEAGIAVDDSAQDKEGHAFKGVLGLKKYLSGRDAEFYALFSRKLLGYALGRKVLPTDKLLLTEIQNHLKSDDPTFAGAVLAVVQSRQFQNRRGE